MNLKQRLKGKLTENELSQLIRAFEILGDIAIIQVPESLENKKQIIAQAVLDQHKHVKTVLRKTEKIQNEFRIPKYEILIGTETETIYKENNCRFKLDSTKVYFSEKLGTERIRILNQVQEGEVILALFAGVGPYPILIAKNKNVRIYAIEKNPKAVEYLNENIVLNKVSGKIQTCCGDVKEVLPILNIIADRTLMPLPKTGEQFLDLAFKYTKKGGIVHYYCFGSEQDLVEIKKKIVEEGKKQNKKVEFLNVCSCGVFSPRVYRFCVDFRVK
jgi:tRNA (guanine37-N1)-methyltransferase